MLLEIVLYFLLGFLTAVLLVLMVAPSIWNRAVILTKHKIEGSLPLSLNEIQAQKDKLRAEYAMTTRRLELAIEDLRSKASEQLIELQTKRDDANRFNHLAKERLVQIEKLENSAELMRTNLSENSDKIESLTNELEQKKQDFFNLREQNDELKKQHSQVLEESNKAKVDLIATESKIQSLSGTLATVHMTDEERTQKINSLIEQTTKLKNELKEQKAELKEQKKIAIAAERQADSSQVKLENAEARLANLASTHGNEGGRESKLREEISDLTKKVITENARVIELEAKLAKFILRGEIDKSKQDLDPLAALSEEGSLVASEIRNISNGNMENSENIEHLKEKLLDLAAKTTVMAAASNADDHSIREILASENDDQTSSNHVSIAERARELRNTKTR